MGGYGSGRWDRWNTKALVTSYLSLDVRRFHREGLLQPGAAGSLVWQNDAADPQSSIGVQVGRDHVTLRYRSRYPGGEWQDVTEPVHLTWTTCHYGGSRPWFRCPGVVNNVLCDHRVAKLYARSHYFLCRHCSKLAYPSQNVSVADRPLTRAQTIRRQLGGAANLLEPFPWKPKGMHWQTYWRLWDKARREELKHLGMMQSSLGRLNLIGHENLTNLTFRPQ